MVEKAKKIFFDELYQLDEDSDGLEDRSNASVMLEQSQLPPSKSAKRRVIHDLRLKHSLGRTVSAPIAQSAKSFPTLSPLKGPLKVFGVGCLHGNGAWQERKINEPSGEGLSISANIQRSLVFLSAQ